MNEIISTFLLAMTPIGELRVSLPLALTVYKLHWLLAYLISVLGNLVPAFFLLLFLEPISKWLSQNFKIFNRFFFWLFERTGKKADGIKNRKYVYPTLALFVAIPLPMTGVWSGTIIAFLLNLPFQKAFPAIAVGVLGAGAIVAIATKAGIAINKYFGLPTLLAVMFIVSIGFVVYRKLKSVTK